MAANGQPDQGIQGMASLERPDIKKALTPFTVLNLTRWYTILASVVEGPFLTNDEEKKLQDYKNTYETAKTRKKALKGSELKEFKELTTRALIHNYNRLLFWKEKNIEHFGEQAKVKDEAIRNLVGEIQAEMVVHNDELDEKDEKIRRLEREVKRLEDELGTNPNNSNQNSLAKMSTLVAGSVNSTIDFATHVAAALAPAIPAGQQLNPTDRVKEVMIEKFMGGIEEWLLFFEAFVLKYHKAHISPAARMGYLVSLMGPNPVELIRHFPKNGAFYHQALTTLIEEYGSESKIIAFYYGKLYNLPHATNNQTLKQLYLTTSQCAYHLGILGRCDNSLTAWLELKLDPRIRLEMRRAVGKDLNLLPLAEYLRAIKTELDIRSAHISADIDESRQPRVVQQASALVAGAERLLCYFCNEHGHYHQDCRKVTDPTQRYQIIVSANRCTNCFKKGHNHTQCGLRNMEKGSCRTCHRHHHTALHGYFQMKYQQYQQRQHEAKRKHHSQSSNKSYQSQSSKPKDTEQASKPAKE